MKTLITSWKVSHHIWMQISSFFPDEDYYFDEKLSISIEVEDSDYYNFWSSEYQNSNTIVFADFDPKKESLLIRIENRHDEYLFQLIFLEDGSWGYELEIALDNGSYCYNIPSTYRGLPVISIADDAFRLVTKIVSLSIPESIRHIGKWAFFCGDFLFRQAKTLIDGWLLSCY